MSRQSIRKIVLLGLLALVGLLGMMGYWFKEAHDLEERQFQHKVHLTLRAVGDQLLKLQGDSTSPIPPIRTTATNSYLLLTECPLNKKLVDSLFRVESVRHQLGYDFYYQVFPCNNDLLIWGNQVTAAGKGTVACLQREWEAGCYNVGLTIPGKPLQLAGSQGMWIGAGVLVLLIFGFFSFTLYAILKEKRLAEVKSDFINNMTHEFKTPITTISMASEILKKPDATSNPERLLKYATIIYDENQRLKQQVERVLQMAALEKKELKLQRKPLNVHEIIQQVVNRFKLALEGRKGKLWVQLKADHPDIEADKVHLTNIINNLLDNADKYSPQAPEIGIETHNTTGGILIRVIDKGIGISKEAQKQIFERFYRVPTGDVHDVKGFGLGLCYVRMMAEAHGGRIAVQSEPGKGSTFEVFLPF